MERIASFCVDHTKLDRGMYLSRQDGDVLTWDILIEQPKLDNAQCDSGRNKPIYQPGGEHFFFSYFID